MKTLAEAEEWRPVVGWEGLYEVSSHGRVRSLDRRTRTRNPQKTRLHRGRVMRLDYKNNLNHGRVRLQGPSGARSKFIHRLVAEAFIGPQPEGKPFVLHWDDDPHNNAPGNLRWGTPMDNYNDAVRNGSKTRDPSHCPRGHAYKGGNLINNSAGGKRCRECELSSDRLRHFEKLGRGLPTGDHRHGTYAGYRAGCRCHLCQGSNREYKASWAREDRRKRRESKDTD